MLMLMRQVALILALAAAPLAAQAGFGPLAGPDALGAALDGADAPVVLDIRGRRSYERGHIPGARNAPYGLFRGPAENPGELVTEAHLTEVLRGLGLATDTPVVVVHQGSNQTDFGSAARVYWTLKSSGFTDLAVLNGGMNAWEEAKGRVETGPMSEVAPSDIAVTFSDQWLATRADVQAIVEGREEARLVDARPEAFWRGQTKHGAAARPGTIPQSQYFTHDRWFGSDAPSLIKPDLVRRLAAENGFTNGDRLVSFCNTGHWAATNWFALSELAGIEGVRLYPESVVGWSIAGMEMANVPGLFQNMINKITGKY
ncbi:MAG: rhodanese-like domain-containing protein [Roseovarius sp.]|nr:rhodanese-like domain-containing protein [Roseovarius sp.]